MLLCINFEMVHCQGRAKFIKLQKIRALYVIVSFINSISFPRLVQQNLIFSQQFNTMRYSKISYVKRTKLLNLVEKQGYGVTQAARILRLKVPTAKAILYTYRNKGHIYSKKSDKTACNSSVEQNAPEVPSKNFRHEEVVASPLVIPQVERFNYFPVYYWFPTVDSTNIVQL